MRVPRRLVVGATGLSLLVLVCVLAPLALTPVGDGDPVHAELLPPGTRVTVLELDDGRTLVSPSVEKTPAGYLVRSPRRTTTVPVAVSSSHT